MEAQRENDLLQAWVTLSWIVKNRRITKGLMYNEATVMMLLYNRYLTDGVGLISIKEIVEQTRMLKSLVNRTVSALERKGLLVRCPGTEDKRTVFVKCVEDKLDTFLQVHRSSLQVAQNIIAIIGEEDANTFIRIVQKLDHAGYKV